MVKWKKGGFERIKARAIGTYQFSKSKEFGENGPGPDDIGYVLTKDRNTSFGENEVFYSIYFEKFPGRRFIGFDYSGKFEPFQEVLF